MRWILVATRGRQSGKPHEVLVDLLGEDVAPERYFVQAAYGRSADWVRNIEAHGSFEAQVGRDRFAATLVTLSGKEAREVMMRYLRAHPLYSPLIAWMLGYRGSLGKKDDVADWLVESFGMFAVLRQAQDER
jgi:deazaflavin-dependent oxidoreductase (nitroreductase family)